MANLNTYELIESVLSLIQDNSQTIRTRLLSYLNTSLQTLINERDWNFAKLTATITLVNGIIITPSDFDRMTEIVGDGFVLTHSDLLAIGRLSAPYQTKKCVEVPTGLQLIPATDGEIDLTYIPTIPAYTEAEETLFPQNVAPFVKRSVLTSYYEYDMDERWSTSATQAAKELLSLKRWDNTLKPLPQYDDRGLLR